MRLLLLYITLFITTTLAGQNIYPRYNHLAYLNNGEKKIIVMADEASNDYTWEIKNINNESIIKGTLGISVSGVTQHTPKPFNYLIDFSNIKTPGTYNVIIQSVTPFEIKIDNDPYKFIPQEILRYLRVQRSGSAHTLDTKYSHVGDKSCPVYHKKGGGNTTWNKAEGVENVDMLGGWYDAGDYIKFTLTTAYTTYMLLRAYEIYPEMYQEKVYSKTKLPDLLDEAHHGLTWLLKTMPNDQEFIIQVGGAADHQQGERLPHLDELDGKRQAYSAISPTQMGYTAAALATAARVFKSIDEKFSKECEAKAIAIFAKAETSKDVSWVEEGWEKFYADNTPNDNMALAAIELYYSTNDKNYLRKAKQYTDDAKAGYWSSWGNVNMVAHTRILPQYPNAMTYLYEDLNHFKGIATNDNIWGIAHEYTWSTLYSMLGVANATMLLDIEKNGKPYRAIPLDLANYMLGMNNWGVAMIASENIPNSVRNIYAQVYKLKPKLYPTGAIAEGPGDRATHDSLRKYFKLPEPHPNDQFNTKKVVFYDENTDFQCMETTIVGLADGLLFFTLLSKLHTK